MSLIFPDGSRTLPNTTGTVGGPVIRRDSGGGMKPISGNSAVSNLLNKDEPVPMGQPKPVLIMAPPPKGLSDDELQEYMTRYGESGRPPSGKGGRMWFPPADPRNDPNVLDPQGYDPGVGAPQRPLYDPSQPDDFRPKNNDRPPTNSDRPSNPFSGLGQSELQSLLEQLQEMLGGGAGGRPGHPNPGAPYQTPPWRPESGGAGPTRPGGLYNADQTSMVMPGQRPTRPQSGMEDGYEPPDYVDDIRPPGQRPFPGYATRSDRRLKSQIVRIGTHPQHGIGIYDYVIDGHPDTGVMAQELMSVLPSAVSVGDDGYMMVDYSAL